MAAIGDKFGKQDSNSPAMQAVAANLSDGVDDPNGISKAILVGAAGNVVFRDAVGNQVTITGATAGSVIPVRVSRVLSTGTTATIYMLYS